jgi:hypothetical protein
MLLDDIYLIQTPSNMYICILKNFSNEIFINRVYSHDHHIFIENRDLHILICNFNVDFFLEINLVSARFAFFEKLYCLESDNFQVLIKQPKKQNSSYWSHIQIKS